MKTIKIILIIIFVFLGTSLFAQESLVTISKNETIKVVPPEGTTDKILGMGYDNQFNELNIQVLKGKKNITNEARYLCDYKQIENLVELEANAKVFSLAKGGINKKTNKRYAVLNIYQVDKTITLEPQGLPLGNAEYYVSKILYGWSLNYIICGESEEFSSTVSANLQKWISIGGDLKTYALALNLQQELKLIGLLGKDEGVIIAKTPEETLGKFKKSKYSVPILIEFKAINNINTQGIEWVAPIFTEGNYTLRNIEYKISERKSDGNYWDAGFGSSKKPDVFTKIYLDDKEINTSGICKDSFDGDIRIEKIITLTSKSRIKLVFFDNDMLQNDKIGEAEISFNDLSKFKLNEDIFLKTSGQLQKCIFRLMKQ